MPAVVPFIPLIAAGTAAGATIYGAHSQQSAQREASRIDSGAAREALDYQKEQDAYERQRSEEERDYGRGKYEEDTLYDRGQYADYLGRLDPYRAAGTGALTRLSSHFGGSSPSMTYARPTSLNLPQVTQPGASSGVRGGTGMIVIQAPDGSTREVPASQAEHYISRGGVVVK